MSQQNLLNGVPPQMNQTHQNVVVNDKLNHFNGIHSSKSSRDSSPSTQHFNQIPASQLPPTLPPITSSSSPSLTTLVASSVPRPALITTTAMQNPPINTQTNQLTQKMGQLSVNSPQFGTLTPTQIVQQKTSVLSNSAFSPIISPSSNLQTNQRPVMNQFRPILAPQQQQQQFNNLNMPQMNQNRPVLNQNPVIPPLQQQNRQINNYYNQGRVDSGLPPPQPTTTTNQSPNVPGNISQTTTNYQGNLQQPAPPPPTSTQYKTNLHVNRYPQSPQYSQPQSSPYHQQQQQQQQQNQQQYYPENSVTRSGFNKLWGYDHIDLLQNPNILPSEKLEPPNVYLGQEQLNSANCSPELFRCTMTKIPETNSLLQKSRLPLGVLIHPFKDLAHLPVIQCHVIVRCRACRTYINPFVYFVDMKRWKCNLCYRLNDLPEEFQYDPVSKTYGDPSRRPEIKSSTIEYIAPAEYMLRPPQPAIYLFLLDISRLAIESGYLQSVCSVLLDELKNLPGDARTQVGIIAYDSTLHFFQLGEGLSQPHEMIMLDIDDVFLPSPDNLLINLKDCMDLLIDLLNQLPTRYNNSYDNNSALGAALQAGYKLMSPTGGRITVFQATLPNLGPGALLSREDPNQRSSNDVTNLNPANDFYKRLALECSAQQIAVDLFIINSQYVDLATISGISQFSGGCINHFPLFKASNYIQNEQFERCLRRYLTRKIGFESVMRIRCTRGLSIHTFHGNFFVRSTDLLSLPNINPDAGFGMQVSIDENLTDVQTVCFQAALLYTSSKGERRIRVHTLCLPVCSTLMDVVNSADQQCIIGLLAKMAVDRSLQSSLTDAREAFINAAIDVLSSYKLLNNIGNNESSLLLPHCLKLLPLYISAILKHTAFRTGVSTRLDDRVKAMIDMKTKPLIQLIQMIYPDLYPVHNLDECKTIITSNDEDIPQPSHLQLTARYLHAKGAFLMDCGQHMILLVCPGVSQIFLNQILGVPDYLSITDDFYELPILDNIHNTRLHRFINYLNDDKPYAATLHIIRDNSTFRVGFYERLIEDRYENSLSYHEFLQHLKSQVK